MSLVRYAGLDLAKVVHALYHGTRSIGNGRLADRPDLPVEECRGYDSWARRQGGRLRLDWVEGRPLKIVINVEMEMIDTRLYDEYAGAGSGAKIIAGLRAEAAR